jgi:hypothetical protein
MKRKPRGVTAGTKAVRGPKATKRAVRSVKAAQSAKSAKQGRQGGDLEKTLAPIRRHPGIRPSEINRLLKREESDGLRGTLIKRGLIRKEKDGAAMHTIPSDARAADAFDFFA